MRSADGLIRKKALDKLSSAEQLDTLLRVTSPVGWVALATLGVIILATVLWSIFGRINIRVDGSGILLRGGVVAAIQAPAAGRVEQLMVAPGDMVRKGMQVAELSLHELKAEIAATQSRIDYLSEQKTDKTHKMHELRAAYQAQLAGLNDQLRRKKELLKRKLAREQDVLAVEGQIAAVRAQILQVEMGEGGIQGQLKEEENKLRQLNTNLKDQSIVVSPYEGQVSALLAKEGEQIATGARLLTVEADQTAAFEVVLFVPFAEGKKVQPEMGVKISPTTVKPEEHGFIVGTISSISPQPVTPEEVRTTLNNEALAQKFAKDTPFKVKAIPTVDTTTKSGFRWTSAKGPPIEISSGTPCNAQVVVDRKAPIEYVIPMLRKLLGMS